MVERDDGFDSFVADSYPRLVRTAFLLTGDRGHAEDLVQSCLLRTYLGWGRLHDHDNAEAYARTVLFRLWSRWRRRRWRAEIPTAAIDTATADQKMASVETADLVLRCLMDLPADQRAVLVLRYYEGCSEAETARLLGCRPGTVKSRAARALAALRASGLLTEQSDAKTVEDRGAEHV